MTALLLRLWPALIPIAIYLLWKMLRQPDASYSEVLDAEEVKKPHWIKTPIFWVVISSGLLVIFSLVFLGVSSQINVDGNYVPPEMVDGKLIDGHME